MNILSHIFLNSKSIIDIIYPQVCVCCGKIASNWICEKCNCGLEKYRVNKYNKNPQYIEFASANDKIYREIFFDETFHMFIYREKIRNLIIRYKFNDESFISNFFINEIYKNKKIDEILSHYDIIVSVPMDRKGEMIRGFNQTSLILKELKKKGIKGIDTNCLKKIVKTKTQSKLSGMDRESNVRNAYLVSNKNAIMGKNVVVFDDIFTTGATANEIARILKENGAKKVLIFTLAKD